jgi:hypothetical protein
VEVVDYQSQRMKNLKNSIKDIPFVMLLINGIGWVLNQFDIYQSYYFYMSQISGHGILTCIFMGFYSYVHRFCLYSKICIGALITLNILNLFYNLLPLSYYNVYSFVIIFTGVIIGFIRYVKCNVSFN